MQLISISKAAKILGTHTENVIRFINLGKLKSVKLNKQFRTSAEWIAQLEPDAIQNDLSNLQLNHEYFK